VVQACLPFSRVLPDGVAVKVATPPPTATALGLSQSSLLSFGLWLPYWNEVVVSPTQSVPQAIGLLNSSDQIRDWPGMGEPDPVEVGTVGAGVGVGVWVGIGVDVGVVGAAGVGEVGVVTGVV